RRYNGGGHISLLSGAGDSGNEDSAGGSPEGRRPWPPSPASPLWRGAQFLPGLPSFILPGEGPAAPGRLKYWTAAPQALFHALSPSPGWRLDPLSAAPGCSP